MSWICMLYGAVGMGMGIEFLYVRFFILSSAPSCSAPNGHLYRPPLISPRKAATRLAYPSGFEIGLTRSKVFLGWKQDSEEHTRVWFLWIRGRV